MLSLFTFRRCSTFASFHLGLGHKSKMQRNASPPLIVLAKLREYQGSKVRQPNDKFYLHMLAGSTCLSTSDGFYWRVASELALNCQGPNLPRCSGRSGRSGPSFPYPAQRPAQKPTYLAAQAAKLETTACREMLCSGIATCKTNVSAQTYSTSSEGRPLLRFLVVRMISFS